jgi:hypothetical protein
MYEKYLHTLFQLQCFNNQVKNTVNLRSSLANYKELHVVQINTHKRTSQNTDSASTFLRQSCYIIHFLTSQATLLNLPSDAPPSLFLQLKIQSQIGIEDVMSLLKLLNRIFF